MFLFQADGGDTKGSPKDSSDDDIKVEDDEAVAAAAASAAADQSVNQINSQSMSASSDFLGNQLANYFSQLFEKNQTDSFIQKQPRSDWLKLSHPLLKMK